MKKIVSVLSVAALALSSIFAAEVSLSYKTAGTLYKEVNQKDYATDDSKQSTREALNQKGYADAKSDVVISAKTDWAGFVLDFDPDASSKSAMGFDQYYGWLNYGPLQVTSGKWESRYGVELDDDKGTWERVDFNRYHLGVINGKWAHDVDNLTATLADDGANKGVNGKAKRKTEQQLATVAAFTVRPNDGTYIMLKGALVNAEWGSTVRDTNHSYTGAYTTTDGTGADIAFHSGFASEFAFHVDNSIDVNVVVKSLKRDNLVIAGFVRPTIGNTNLLFGVTAGLDIAEYKDGKGDDTMDSKPKELGFDFRLRTKLSDALTLTTMHNVSLDMTTGVPKDQKYDDYSAVMWNMVSLGYKVSEKTLLQLTVHNECNLFKHKANEKSDGNDTDGPRTLGGYNISIIPGVVYSFNENASLTAGLKWDIYNVGALQSWKDSQTGYIDSSSFSIPVVFKVSL